MTDVDLNTVAGGGLGGLGIAALLYVGRLLLDRFVPSRTDKRGDVAQAFEVLKEISSILRAEKKEDADRITAKQTRIDTLEGEAEKDWDTIRQLRAEVAELNERITRKEKHIQQLTEQIERLGARVIVGETDIEITMPRDDVRRLVSESQE